MPEALRPGRIAVPEFGTVVVRDRLLRLFDRTRPAATVISAPAAYGKSVLASQIARRHGDGAIWFHIPSGCITSTEILSHAILALSGTRCHVPADEFVPVSPLPSAMELLFQLETLVGDSTPDAKCVVFDNLSAEASGAVCELAGAALSCGSRLAHVFTLRSTTTLPQCPLGVWQIGSRELLLDDDEVRDLVSLALGDEPGPDVLSELVRCSGRQPGLLSLMARCVASEPEDWRSVLPRHDIWDALWRLAISQLDEREQYTLQCMALLGAGTLNELSQVLGDTATAASVAPVGVAIPLVSLEGRGAGCRFRLHELAQQAFAVPGDFVCSHRGAFERALAGLAARGDEERVISLAAASEDPGLLASWLEAVGFRVLRRGGIGVLWEALSGLTAVQLVDRPRLLVLKAACELDSGSIEAAYRDSSVARELAEQDGDDGTLANAMLVLARSTAGLCNFVLARTYFDRATELCGASADLETLTHLHGRRLAMSALFGDSVKYEDARASLVALASRDGKSGEGADLLARFFIATSDIILCGSWADSASALESCSRSESLHLSVRVAAAYNFFGCVFEMGRLEEAEAALSKYVELTSGAGNDGWDATPRSLRAGLQCVRGAVDGVCDEVRDAAEREWERGEPLCAATELTTTSAVLLGSRRAVEGLRLAELAARWADGICGSLVIWPARLEVAACKLALDDEAVALKIASQCSRELDRLPARHLRLRTDLILAEIDLRRGDLPSATKRLFEHVEYVLTESANLQLALNVRAFPRLLAPVALAVGAANLPVHMLNMILPEYAEDAVAAAKGVVPPEEFDILSQRLLGRKSVGRRSTDSLANNVCTVRLFGGLQVEANGRTVQDREWRKRKARLLFAMLATRCGKDIPREQLMEYLWPEMDADQALNNLYVVWSSMKSALSPGLGRGADCPYVEHRRGICRTASGRVITDLDEFDDQIALAGKARSAGDGSAELTALQRIAEIYRGELLPGEAYDDWFAALRERYRHDFEDAMLRAAALLEGRGDVQGGVSLLRRALQHDPWREDLYQAALRMQMLGGQRSAAIEMYLTCRTRLVDDLGIDPSAETTRLYEQVLGMEDAVDEYPH